MKPSNKLEDVPVVEVEGSNDETPRPRGSQKSKELVNLSDNEDPYVTPFPLEKKKKYAVARLAPPPDDTEAEDSEIEKKLRGKVNKKVKSSSDKVR